MDMNRAGHTISSLIDATVFSQISMTTATKWRKRTVKHNPLNAEGLPASTSLRLLFLPFLSLGDLNDRSLIHLGGKLSKSTHSYRRESPVGDKVLSTEIIHFAFTDFTVDSLHPLSPV